MRRKGWANSDEYGSSVVARRKRSREQLAFGRRHQAHEPLGGLKRAEASSWNPLKIPARPARPPLRYVLAELCKVCTKASCIDFSLLLAPQRRFSLLCRKSPTRISV